MGAWRIHKESLTAQDTPGDRYRKRSVAGLRCSRADSVNPGLNFLMRVLYSYVQNPFWLNFLYSF